jgi:hypothetical protein
MNVFAKLLVGAILLFAVSVANAQNVDGVLRVVKGDVQIKSAKTGQTVKARIGEKVFPKDMVITGKDSRAKIVMVDNNEINVSPESQIEIQRYELDPSAGKKDVLLNVIYGKVRAKVEQKYDGRTSKFQVKTPSAVAGVRGTDFMTSYNKVDKSSQVITFRGAVEFGLPGPNGAIMNPVSVTPGKTANSVAGAAPGAPTNMPKSELAKMDNDTKADTAGPASGKGDRQPSNDKGDKKGEGDKRGPASTGPAPTKDVGFDASKDGAANPDNGHPGGDHPVIQPPPPPPPMAPPTTIPKCDTCNQLIQNGNGKTNVNVHIK